MKKAALFLLLAACWPGARYTKEDDVIHCLADKSLFCEKDGKTLAHGLQRFKTPSAEKTDESGKTIGVTGYYRNEISYQNGKMTRYFSSNSDPLNKQTREELYEYDGDTLTLEIEKINYFGSDPTAAMTRGNTYYDLRRTEYTDQNSKIVAWLGGQLQYVACDMKCLAYDLPKKCEAEEWFAKDLAQVEEPPACEWEENN